MSDHYGITYYLKKRMVILTVITRKDNKNDKQKRKHSERKKETNAIYIHKLIVACLNPTLPYRQNVAQVLPTHTPKY